MGRRMCRKPAERRLAFNFSENGKWMRVQACRAAASVNMEFMSYHPSGAFATSRFVIVSCEQFAVFADTPSANGQNIMELCVSASISATVMTFTRNHSYQRQWQAKRLHMPSKQGTNSMHEGSEHWSLHKEACALRCTFGGRT